ncbi:VOC family protein [Roseicyclus persicicus]|uniref:VOC family protein n=1 Tax=Roseicyclus persicicus TaxID=2650661 RepID=A0A7X6JY52_9RHOB|nr:VOC family protein [Roseibacterium persicicum]NKX43453.1 VOC family protein [Roseibacterium persicicum]
MLVLDHIAVAAERLEDGAAAVERALGLPLQPGGQHPHMGTHNRLMGLGPEYLEVIAIDPEGQAPAQPRWFDLDNFRGAPRATTWICRCDDLEAALAAAPEGVGVPWSLARADLRWRMAVPKDGKLPFGGLFPALIQWEGTAHPAPRLAQLGARLSRLRLVSPEAGALRAALAPLVADQRIEVVEGPAPRMEAVIATHGGEVVL